MEGHVQLVQPRLRIAMIRVINAELVAAVKTSTEMVGLSFDNDTVFKNLI